MCFIVACEYDGNVYVRIKDECSLFARVESNYYIIIKYTLWEKILVSFDYNYTAIQFLNVQ